MDFTKLNIGAEKKKAATTAKFEPMQDSGKPFLNGNGEPLLLDILAVSSPEGSKEFRKWQKKYGGEQDLSEASEAELDAAVERDEVSGAEFIARMVAGWNVSDAGKPVTCDLETKVQFFEAFEAVAVAVSNEITRIAGELGKSKPA